MHAQCNFTLTEIYKLVAIYKSVVICANGIKLLQNEDHRYHLQDDALKKTPR